MHKSVTLFGWATLTSTSSLLLLCYRNICVCVYEIPLYFLCHANLVLFCGVQEFFSACSKLPVSSIDGYMARHPEHCAYLLFFLVFLSCAKICYIYMTMLVCVPYGRDGKSMMISGNTCTWEQQYFHLERRRDTDKGLEGSQICYLCCKWDVISFNAHSIYAAHTHFLIMAEWQMGRLCLVGFLSGLGDHVVAILTSACVPFIFVFICIFLEHLSSVELSSFSPINYCKYVANAVHTEWIIPYQPGHCGWFFYYNWKYSQYFDDHRLRSFHKNWLLIIVRTF